MDILSSKYRKPKSRPSKRKQAALDKVNKRWSAKKALIQLPEQSVTAANMLISKGESTPSTSAKKIQTYAEISKRDCSSKSCAPNYALVNVSMWDSLLSNVKCSECLSGALTTTSGTTLGFATKLSITCKDCGYSFGSSFSSPREAEEKCFQVNKKIVEAFLKMGKGHAAMEIFSMVLGIQSMDKKTFSKCLNSLSEDGENVKKAILEIARTAVRNKHQEMKPSIKCDDIIDITVSFDGTWQKRGHTSLHGMGIVIDALTGLIIDFEVLSKYCPECSTAAKDLSEDSAEFAFWFEGHKPLCQKNHDGSSGSMEVTAAVLLWGRSIDECRMRYTTMLSDGDSKTFQHLEEVKPYGANAVIKKEECLNHVAKRMGTGVRNKVKEWRGKKICLGGKKPGSLKETTINKLSNFYRKAIKDNIPCVDKMKTAIFATLYHASSTDVKPKHNKCPVGVDSWCFFQRALATSSKPKSHKTMKTQISEIVLEKILPVYQRLASDELLSRCISGKTQNANESLHSVIWKNCPKETFVSKKRLELSVVSSISQFNFGCLATLEIADANASDISLSIAKRRDKRRIQLSEKKSDESYKLLRNKKKYCKAAKSKKDVKTEGTTYTAGMF